MAKFCSRKCAQKGMKRGEGQTPEQRFWNKINKAAPNGCWEWTGSTANGYGQLKYPGQIRAHRTSWELHSKKKIPFGMCVLHKCDNPPCVNPKHLWLGTALQNTRDMIKKKRARSFRGPFKRDGNGRFINLASVVK